jgi:hypothetical protein
MNLGRRALTLATATSALVSALLFATPAHAAANFTVSVQSLADDTNLDTPDSTQVWTRDPSLTYQVWVFTQVVGGADGSSVYTIQSTTFGNCIQDMGPNAPVQQAACSPDNLAQRWEVNFAQNSTLIASEKHRNYVLQGNGLDTPVTLSPVTFAANQTWIPYQK